MVGVSGPMHTFRRSAGRRFLTGLTVGSALGGVALSTVATGTGLAFQRIGIHADVKVAIVGTVAAVLGMADWSGHTPQWFRQVPQRFIHQLPPGTLGVVWGLDLGLVFTTKKVTSLWTIALLGLLVLRPTTLLVVIPLGSTVTALAIVLWSYQIQSDTRRLTDPSRPWVPVIVKVWGVGAVILGLSALTTAAFVT